MKTNGYARTDAWWLHPLSIQLFLFVCFLGTNCVTRQWSEALFAPSKCCFQVGGQKPCHIFFPVLGQQYLWLAQHHTKELTSLWSGKAPKWSSRQPRQGERKICIFLDVLTATVLPRCTDVFWRVVSQPPMWTFRGVTCQKMMPLLSRVNDVFPEHISIIIIQAINFCSGGALLKPQQWIAAGFVLLMFTFAHFFSMSDKCFHFLVPSAEDGISASTHLQVLPCVPRKIKQQGCPTKGFHKCRCKINFVGIREHQTFTPLRWTRRAKKKKNIKNFVCDKKMNWWQKKKFADNHEKSTFTEKMLRISSSSVVTLPFSPTPYEKVLKQKKVVILEHDVGGPFVELSLRRYKMNCFSGTPRSSVSVSHNH